MNKQRLCIYLIVFGLLLNIAMVFIPGGGGETWENQYGKLEVYPDVSRGIVTQVQYCNLTSYIDDTNIDVTFRFDIAVGNPNIWMWKNISHDVFVYDYGNVTYDYSLYDIISFIELTETPSYVDYGDIPSLYYYNGTINNGSGDVNLVIGFDSFDWLDPEHTSARFYYDVYRQTGSHIEQQYWFDWKNIKDQFNYILHGGKHYYYVRGWLIKDKLYQFKWSYDVPLGSSGKWSLLSKKSSDPLGTWRVSIDPWWNSSWDYRKLIIIDNSKVDANLVNFPVLVYNASDSDLASHAQADGDDICFIDWSDNATQFAHEIEKWDSGTGELVCWVNVTSVSSSVDTKFWMYYGNDDASNQQDVPGTWDSNYIGVWHMDESSGDCIDSTSNGNDGTYQGNLPTRITGKIGYGQDFDGIGDYITLPSGTFVDAAMSFECWFESDATDETDCIYQNVDDINNRCTLYLYSDLRYNWHMKTGGATQFDIYAGFRTTNWEKISAVYQVNDAELRINTGSIGIDNSVTVGSWSYSGINVGRRYTDSAAYADGVMDEVRISNARRSNNWLDTTYETQNAPSTFLSFGSEQIRPYAPYLSGEVPVNESTSVGLTPELYVVCIDNNSDMMTATWRSNSSGGWVDFAINSSISTGTNITQDNSNFSDYNTMYWWSVNLSDGTGLWGNETYYFTTETEVSTFPSNVSSPVPSNGSIDVCLVVSLGVTIADNDSACMNISFHTNYTGSWLLIGLTNFSNVVNGTYYKIAPDLELYNTTYYWRVTVTAGVNTVTRIYHFTTASSPCSVGGGGDMIGNNAMSLSMGGLGGVLVVVLIFRHRFLNGKKI